MTYFYLGESKQRERMGTQKPCRWSCVLVSVWERHTVRPGARRDSCQLTAGNAVSSTSNLGVSSWSLMRSEGQSPNHLIQKKETVELQSQQHDACQIWTCKCNVIKAKTKTARQRYANAKRVI